MLSQVEGQSSTEIMSQKAVTDALHSLNTDLTDKLEEEAKNRADADNELSKRLDKEIQDRIEGDSSFREMVNTEAKERKAEDKRIWDNTPHLESGLIPATYLPSYVDDVIEYDKEVNGNSWKSEAITVPVGNLVWVSATSSAAGDFYRKFARNTNGTEAGLEIVEPEIGKIYVNINNDKTYRWSGSNLVEISKSIGLGETSSAAYPGNKGKELEDRIENLEEIGGTPAFTKIGSNGVYYEASETPYINFSGEGGIYMDVKKTGNTAIIRATPDKDYLKGAENGIAPLDEDRKIPMEYLSLENYTTTEQIQGLITDIQTKLNTIEEGAQKNVPAFTGIWSKTVNPDEGSQVSKILAENQRVFELDGKSGQLNTRWDKGSGILQFELADNYLKGKANGIAPLNSESKIDSQYIDGYTLSVSQVSTLTPTEIAKNKTVVFSAGGGIEARLNHDDDTETIRFTLSSDVVRVDASGKIKAEQIPDREDTFVIESNGDFSLESAGNVFGFENLQDRDTMFERKGDILTGKLKVYIKDRVVGLLPIQQWIDLGDQVGMLSYTFAVIKSKPYSISIQWNSYGGPNITKIPLTDLT